MSDTFDHFGEAYDQACTPEDNGDEVFKYNKTCRRCGESGLYWHETEKGWRLYHEPGQIHVCEVTSIKLPVLDHKKIRRDIEFDRLSLRNPLDPDHYWGNVRYQMQHKTTKTPELAKPAEEKETDMDFTLIHCNQTDYVALEVKFDGSKPYFYKAESSDNFRAGDHVVVMVDGSLKIASVTAVYTNPIAHLESGRAYNWVVQKINMSKYAARSEMQNRMIEQLKVWEAQRRIMEAAEAQTRMIAGLPGAEAALSDFKRLGSTVVEINL